ncbi:MAG: S-layer homology domain-containing protein, partial [Clostridiales bacterium]|nr:S-layer homology domain-containing protein [Clostridiales bacterium]
YDHDITITDTIPTKDGYTFSGWVLEGNTTETLYTSGNEVTIDSIWSYIDTTTTTTTAKFIAQYVKNTTIVYQYADDKDAEEWFTYSETVSTSVLTDETDVVTEDNETGLPTYDSTKDKVTVDTTIDVGDTTYAYYDAEFGTDEDGNSVLYIRYLPDKISEDEDDGEGSDGIPDIYQVKIVYVAGDNGSVDPTVQVETLTDEDGNYVESGDVIASSTAEANDGYQFSAWSSEDGITISDSENTELSCTFEATGGTTYTFTASFEEEPEATVSTFYYTFDDESSDVKLYYSVNGDSSLTELVKGETLTVEGQYPVVFYIGGVLEGYKSVLTLENWYKTNEADEYIEASNSKSTELDSEAESFKVGGIDFISSYSAAIEEGCTTEFHYSNYDEKYTYRKFKITYEPIEVTVEYDLGYDTTDAAPTDGNTYYHSNVDEDSCIITITDNPTRDGYTFAGWLCEDIGDILYFAGAQIEVDTLIENNEITDDITYVFVAQWTSNSEEETTVWTVTFEEGKHGDLDGTTEFEYDDGDTIDKVPDVDPDSGYKFVNWYCEELDEEYTTKQVLNIEVDRDLTFVAQYTKKSSGGGSSYKLDEVDTSDDDDEEDYDSDIKLNTEEHFQYISGYPDGTVRPTANITRAEVATIFYRLLDDNTRNAYYSTYTTFDDVDSSQWYLKAIATLTNAGILHGDSDSNTFRPDDNITRAEFATIVSFFDEIVYTDEDAFSDISGHWANVYINSAYAKGWVSGYDGKYNPDTAITRAEAMTLINNVLGREVDEDGLHEDAKQWPDNLEYAWYYYEVLEATNYHEYVIDDDEAEVWTDILPNKTWNEGAA